MSQNNNIVSLKVLEAYTRDVGRGTARIDYDTMGSLGVSTGDIIEIKGNGGQLSNAYHFTPQMKERGSSG
jgi:transitional endoplasmic reticulum ATPase